MDNKEEETVGEHQGIEEAVGAAIGSAGGAVLGTMMGGLIAGPVGMVAGVVAGTVAGAGVGYALEHDPHGLDPHRHHEPGARINYEHYEPEFRRHHESDPARSHHTFEQATPAYRYGWESRQRPEFHDKTYDQVHQDLHKGWTGSSDFADYESYVKHAWDHQAASHEAGSFSQAAKE